jgi:hypothetical protein
MQMGLVPGNLRDEVKHGGAAFVSVGQLIAVSLADAHGADFTSPGHSA